MSENTPVPVTFGDTPENTADRLVRYAQLDALERLCKQERQRIRAEIEDEADTIESATGGAFNVKVPKVGQVYRTAPEPKPVVTDEAELLDWLDQEAPDLVSERDQLRVLDQQKAINLVHAVRKHSSSATKKEIVESILSAFDVTTERSVPTDTIFEALESYGLARPTRDADYITEDGEIVPGTGVKQAERRLTIRVTEKDLFDAELRAAIPALSERNDA